jgi:hypothetical protein
LKNVRAGRASPHLQTTRESFMIHYSSRNVSFFITFIDIHSILVVKLTFMSSFNSNYICMGGLDGKANISNFAHFQVTVSNLFCTCSCLHRRMPVLRSRSLDDARPTKPPTPTRTRIITIADHGVAVAFRVSTTCPCGDGCRPRKRP